MAIKHQEQFMRSFIIVLAIAMILFISDCVPSLHPLYDDRNLTFNPTLIGTWVNEDGEDTCFFQQSGDSAYDVVYTQTASISKFEAHLVKLDGGLFLDTYPEEPNCGNDFYKMHIILAHIFSKIQINGDTLQMALLDNEWLDKQLTDGKINIAHEYIDDVTVLTASTTSLQEFVNTYADDEDAFPNPITYYRRR
jgi:hypothetical protein